MKPVYFISTDLLITTLENKINGSLLLKPRELRHSGSASDLNLRAISDPEYSISLLPRHMYNFTK